MVRRLLSVDLTRVGGAQLAPASPHWAVLESVRRKIRRRNEFESRACPPLRCRKALSTRLPVGSRRFARLPPPSMPKGVEHNGDRPARTACWTAPPFDAERR